MDCNQKFQIITEGQKYGVSEACKKHNISRTLYYRWLNRYKTLGMKGLEDIEKRFTPANKTCPETAVMLLSLIKNHPNFGPRELKYRLDAIGFNISESAVYNIMKRNQLSTKQQRVKFSHKKGKKTTRQYPDFNAMKSGECWLFWTTPYGEFKGIGDLYEYTIYDYKSKIACTRLYTGLSLAYFIDLLTAVAIPVGQSLSFDTKHLCFFNDYHLKEKNKDAIIADIHNTVQKSGFDITAHLLHDDEKLKELYQIRKEYTQYCLSFIMPLAHREITFTDLKIRLQKHIREYNFNYKCTYDAQLFSPIEYYVKSTNNNMILPLWAYIDREY